MNKIIAYITISLIIIYWVYLRFYELDTWSFWIDEWYSSIVSYFSYINNFSPLMLNWDYNFSQYAFTFLQNISFSLFWISDFAARIPSFIISILTIFLYLIFANEIFKTNKDKHIYIIFMMILFVFSTWQIIWAREARFYELLWFIYFISIYFLWKYFVKNDNSYYLYFFISSIIWIFFHPFCFWLIVIWFILFIYKTYKTKNLKNIRKIVILWIIINLYLIIDLSIRYISNWNSNISNPLSWVNYLWDYNFINYLFFYIKSIYSQLWIIFIAYLWMLIFFLSKKKYIEFIIFWLTFIINIVTISIWYMWHTRYMFHLYSLITFIWSLWIILFIHFIIKKFTLKKLWVYILIFIILFWIIKTYKLSIIPQRFYYIDYTSPKPNFKMAYNYLNENIKDAKIISGFPHLCYWYNIKNIEKCEYSIKINLIWNKKVTETLNKQEKEYYSNIKSINNYTELDKNTHYFVLDDLTIKNAINKDIINDVINNCTMIYKDVWNYESSNFLWIWRCN